MHSLLTSLRLLLGLTVILGFIYPVVIYLIALLAFRDKAAGDLITHKEKVIGAKLIGQKFENPRYFLSRPSSSDFNALNSGGSNLSATSLALRTNVKKRKEKFSQEKISPVPSELLFSSGSSLDPDITAKAAFLQVDRILNLRNLNTLEARKRIEELIQHSSNRSFFSKFGKRTLNLLELNILLDEVAK